MQYKQYKEIIASSDKLKAIINDLTIELKTSFKYKSNGLLANDADLKNPHYIELNKALKHYINKQNQLAGLIPTKLKSKFYMMRACEQGKPRYKDNKQALKLLAIENKGL